jgi:dTDP-4-amino-4,6-dideoxygalactose transaminase
MIGDGSIWRKTGTIGDIGIFSFYPSKNLGAYGDGGMIVTDRSGWAKRIKALRMYGESSRYRSDEVSGVSRLDELQAAILSVKLKYLDRWNRRRGEIVKYYLEELDGVGDIQSISNFKFKISNLSFGKTQDKHLKHEKLNSYESRSCHHLFVIRTKKRDRLQKYLAEKGIGSGVHYPVPVHMSPAFKDLGYKKGDFPEAEAQSEEVLSLPLFPELTDSEAETVAGTVKEFFK